MKTISKLIIYACVLLAMVGFSQTKGWRGIVPLRSTRADVERLIGPPDKTSKFYDLGDKTVFIQYSLGSCEGPPGGWNVPRDTVINIEIYFKEKPKLSDLKLDENKYKKVKDLLYQSIIYYNDEEEGVSITFNVDTGLVNSITYLPTAKDNYLRCPAPPENPDDGIEDSQKFDEYSNLSFDQEMKRLTDFATQLQTDQYAKGYIIVYAGRVAHVGEARAHAERAKNYLINERGMDAKRIVTIDGGFREALTVELWVRPNGWRAPKASPTVNPDKVQIIGTYK